MTNDTTPHVSQPEIFEGSWGLWDSSTAGTKLGQIVTHGLTRSNGSSYLFELVDITNWGAFITSTDQVIGNDNSGKDAADELVAVVKKATDDPGSAPSWNPRYATHHKKQADATNATNAASNYVLSTDPFGAGGTGSTWWLYQSNGTNQGSEVGVMVRWWKTTNNLAVVHEQTFTLASRTCPNTNMQAPTHLRLTRAQVGVPSSSSNLNNNWLKSAGLDTGDALAWHVYRSAYAFHFRTP